MIVVFIDAASRGNPGPSGGGIIIKNQGITHEYSLPLGTLSNHEAEFKIFLKALEICQEYDFKTIWLKSDSKIVCDSVDKRFVKNPLFRTYLEKSLAIIDNFDLFFIKWIPERENKQADRLARAAIHKNDKSLEECN